jgi:hypothetical protein
MASCSRIAENYIVATGPWTAVASLAFDSGFFRIARLTCEPGFYSHHSYSRSLVTTKTRGEAVAEQSLVVDRAPVLDKAPVADKSPVLDKTRTVDKSPVLGKAPVAAVSTRAARQTPAAARRVPLAWVARARVVAPWSAATCVKSSVTPRSRAAPRTKYRA